MSARVEVCLVPIPAPDFAALEQGQVPDSLRECAIADGLPPPHVAKRCHQRLAAGKPAFWVGMFYIRAEDGMVVGGCGFKDVPCAREVEIGYGLAESRRGRGYASAALQTLLRMAAESGEVERAVLLITSDNVPSTKVAERAGFTCCGVVLDEDGQETVRWQRALT